MSETVTTELLFETMEKALLHGCKAFSSFIGLQVSMIMAEPGDFAPEDPELPGHSADEDAVVLISDLKGTVGGKSYLVFAKSDAGEFCSKCLPPHYLQDEKMKEGVLLEFDNIITAAVVTVLARELKKNCYAYVPHIHYLTLQSLYNKIAEDFDSDTSIIKIRSKFVIEGCEFEPYFIWAFEKNVLSSGN